MLDVIVNEVKKYAANVRKLEAKADEQCKRLNVIAIVQVKTKSHAVNMLRGLICKDECTSNPGLSKERLRQNTSNFARVFCAIIKNFLALTAYFFALPQTRQHGAQT
ncbi:MAG TPA: hypothetical protein VGN10_17630 [Pyrinomonadaceae bacterium]